MKRGGREDILRASLPYSVLWNSCICKALRLRGNMCLRNAVDDAYDGRFNKYSLDLGDGKLPSVEGQISGSDAGVVVQVPKEHNFVSSVGDSVLGLCSEVFPSLADMVPKEGASVERIFELGKELLECAILVVYMLL